MPALTATLLSLSCTSRHWTAYNNAYKTKFVNIAFPLRLKTAFKLSVHADVPVGRKGKGEERRTAVSFLDMITAAAVTPIPTAANKGYTSGRIHR